MTKKVKVLIGELLLFFVIGVAVIYLPAHHNPRTVPVVIDEMTSGAEKAGVENEKIHTYYINIGEYDAYGCHDYTAYPSYTFNTETGEWSDGGSYTVHGTDFCKVNKYGERTRIGYILAVEYGEKLVENHLN